MQIFRRSRSAERLFREEHSLSDVHPIPAFGFLDFSRVFRRRLVRPETPRINNTIGRVAESGNGGAWGQYGTVKYS